ncbi:hypothetical protein BDQ17DRAFT_1387103 [Cyathus striatus]|nr:hypothetical protein BDQ17DRAFT_1387103 [Cyathus striatus]
MSIRPPLPPRRAPPPPPPRPSLHSNGPKALTALPESCSPPLPVRKQTRPEEKKGSDIDLKRLLARRPPPPPRSRNLSAAAASDSARRRLPPPPTRLPTPPLVNLSSKPKPAEVNQPVDFEDESCIKCHDFSEVDNHAAMFPRQSVSSLPTLAYDLTEPFTTETEKARAIFTWLHHNIAYDTSAFFSGNIQAATPESTLSSGLAVCDGYAGLYKHLLECVGIQARKVTGHGKGFGHQALPPGAPIPAFNMNHAWNCIYVDGVWQLVDPCWGAGALNGTTYTARLAPWWFDSSPSEFVKSHFPEDPSYQMLEEGPMSWADYILEQKPQIYGDFDNFNFSRLYMEPSAAKIEGRQYIDFTIQKRCQHCSTAECHNYLYVLIVGDVQVPLIVHNGTWHARVLVPPEGQISLAWVRTVNGQDAKGLSATDFQTKVRGRMGLSFGFLVQWTVI